MRVLIIIFLSIFCFVGHAQEVDNTIERKDLKSQPYVDFLTGKVKVTMHPKTGTVSGEVTYTFKILEATPRIRIDAWDMQLGNITMDNKKVRVDYDREAIVISADFKPNALHSVTINYKTTPKKALYFVKDNKEKDQIWTQGQGKYTSNWLPSFDDMNEKVEFDLNIQYTKGYEVIANGKLVSSKPVNDSIQSWQYDMTKPMSSYLVALVIGKYEKVVETSESGIPLELYFYPEDKDKFEATYKHSKKIFDFLEKEIGFPYPWQNYKQIPVKDFLYAGMENTGTTIFSDAFVVDETAFVDRNYINVNAHELAHQWFGDLVTETGGTHHWLQEGFATYYALLAEKEIFGEEYFLFKLYENAEQLTALSKTEKATSLLDPNASSLTFYQRGAWAIHALRNLIGDASFKIVIHNYLEKHQFSNATTDDFIAIAEEVSGTDLSGYREQWLESIKFPSQEALNILTKSDFIKNYLSLAQERTQPMAGKWGALKEALRFPVNDYLGQEVVYQLEGKTDDEVIALYAKAFETNNLLVRQTIANTLSTIPKELQEQYESLLKEDSYATIEPALYHLWANFPEKRKEYLDQTKDIVGFTNKNVRILWLVLALSTKEYQTINHQQFYNELSGYTSPKFRFSTRENAFTYLESLQAFSDTTLEHLAEGATHHNWRFRKFCRNILDKLLKDEKYRKKYVDLATKLPKKQQEFIQKRLTP
ncbi:M1 family metallopeptidase [Aquimarina algicola]|uniref:Aminopeptidase N n=1 Tax=Aquimarina algicola TaxID=2589995 RepID=A0A504J321_9FLAO|nr:M1 family metallopeptidase [Aquimarina algicola]TPN82398.1 M1 family metallopeptidase [Aquimarina algicola]